jgi:iron complex outermembrane receptor protein
VGQSINKGIDWDLTVGNDLSFGRLSTTLAGTYVLDSKYTRPGTTDDWISSLGRFGDDNAVVFRTVAKFINTLTHDDFAHSVTLNYRSGYEDQAQYADSEYVRLGSINGEGVDIQLSVPSYATINYQTKYQAMDALGVTFGINNLADRAPPLSLRSGGAGHQVGFDPRYTDVYGRTFYLGLDYKFM